MCGDSANGFFQAASKFLFTLEDISEELNELELLPVVALLVVVLELNEFVETEFDENDRGGDENEDFGEEKAGEAVGLTRAVVIRGGSV
jgi:hypothetical protein